MLINPFFSIAIKSHYCELHEFGSWNFHFPTTMEPKVCFCQEHARQLEVLIVATMKAALSIHVTVQKKRKEKEKSNRRLKVLELILLSTGSWFI